MTFHHSYCLVSTYMAYCRVQTLAGYYDCDSVKTVSCAFVAFCRNRPGPGPIFPRLYQLKVSFTCLKGVIKCVNCACYLHYSTKKSCGCEPTICDGKEVFGKHYRIHKKVVFHGFQHKLFPHVQSGLLKFYFLAFNLLGRVVVFNDINQPWRLQHAIQFRIIAIVVPCSMSVQRTAVCISKER